jgi:hypothetical protein
VTWVRQCPIRLAPDARSRELYLYAVSACRVKVMDMSMKTKRIVASRASHQTLGIPIVRVLANRDWNNGSSRVPAGARAALDFAPPVHMLCLQGHTHACSRKLLVADASMVSLASRGWVWCVLFRAYRRSTRVRPDSAPFVQLRHSSRMFQHPTPRSIR